MNQTNQQHSPIIAKKNKGKGFFRGMFLSLFLVLITFSISSFYFNIRFFNDEVCAQENLNFLEDALNISCDVEDRVVETVNGTVVRENLVDGEALDVSRVYQEVNPSVVGIGIVDTRFENDRVIGSGFVVSNDGYIATNQHVVSDVEAEYFVKFPDDNTTYEVVEVFRDQVNDIAIVKIDKEELNALTLGDSDLLIPGEVVVAIGNPLGELQSTVTSGIISGLDRTVDIGSGSFLRTEVSRFDDTIQTDAAINPGNSGGPLLNASGEVIGINFATVSDANNLSFAIPINLLKNRLEEVETIGRFRIPYLGISYRTSTFQFDGEAFVGARVLNVDLSGGAANILEEGDVIRSFGGTSLDEESLLSLIQKSTIGDEVEIEFIRDRQVQTATIEIVERE